MELSIWFDHGLGDVVQLVSVLQLYKNRGYKVQVHYEQNKTAVFDAAGIPYWDYCCKNYHHWRYYATFNQPDPRKEGSGNKVYLNLNTETLPRIGDRDELWEELCKVNLEGSFDQVVTPAVRTDVSRFLDGLLRPIVLLHTKGTNFQGMKSVSDQVTVELYRRLLDEMPGTIVLLDWDFRVPAPPHGRIRHIKRDWGHINVLELGHLMNQSDLLIGVDSGPWHLANMTRVPALGIFHEFFPWCVSLPRPNGKSAVLTRDSHHNCTVQRRKNWSPIEYAGSTPDAESIAKHAVRMLKGPRYGLPIGRDAMVQQWIFEFCKSSTSTSAIADRNNTLDVLFQLIKNFQAPSIVETGCVRSHEDWSAGYFGYLAGAWIHARGCGNLASVDIDPERVKIAKEICRFWPCEVICSDSVDYLENRSAPIDVLYLDSMDCEIPEHAEHGLREAKAAERLLKFGSLVVLDDTVWDGCWSGKGAKAVPYLLGRGFRVEAMGYQTILRKV